MKKIIISLVSILLIVFSSCYEDSNKATVRINLGNMPIAKQVEKKSIIDKVLSIFVKDAYAQVPAGVIKVHLAAYRGDSLIAKESIDAAEMTSNIVEFSVPVGDNITIVVLGERYEGSVAVFNDIMYYGKTINPIQLISGENLTVNIEVQILDNSIVQLVFNSNGNSYSWDVIKGASNYIIYDEADNVVRKNLVNNISINDYINAYNMKIEFEFTDKLSLGFLLIN